MMTISQLQADWFARYQSAKPVTLSQRQADWFERYQGARK